MSALAGAKTFETYVAAVKALLAGAGFAAATPVALPGKPLTVKIWTGRRLADPAPASRKKAETA